MSDSPSKNDTTVDSDAAFAEICEEHVELTRLLDEIRGVLSERLATVARVAELLNEFCETTEKHFAGEEIGGFFDQILEKSPRLSHTVTEVKAEHELLRQTMHALLQTAKSNGTDDWWDKLEKKFSDFRQSLASHEEAERRLVMDSYWQDTGAQD